MKQKLQIIQGAEIYAPEKLGNMDILFAGEKILAVEESIRLDASGIEVEIISGGGLILVPGLVDSHVHICGGGGEGGFSTRTPEIQLSSILKGGITSVVGVLGTDGTTRTMTNLLAKASGLTEEGINTWVMTGSYQIPVRTLTGSIPDDIILIEKILGTGEVSLSDHRSSHPDVNTFIKLVSDTRLGGMLSGKAGLVNIHMGDSRDTISLLLEAIETSDLPISQLQPTHMNRNPWLFNDAVLYSEKGGFLDFTTSTTPQFVEEGEIPAAEALKLILDKGIDISRISFSSDAQGSLPLFDDAGNLKGLTVGKSQSLLESFIEAVLKWGIPIEKAILPVSTTPAGRYKLPGKGKICAGYDADFLLLNKKDLTMNTLFARGKKMVDKGQVVSFGTFE